MKILKTFVRQKKRPEGSMAEGWLVQESFVWISKYLGRIDARMPRLWSMQDADRFVSEVRQGKGLQFCLSEEEKEKVQSICYANAAPLQKWRQRYEEARQIDSTLPLLPSQSWICDTILQATSNGETVSVEEMDYAYGCDQLVSFVCMSINILYITIHFLFKTYIFISYLSLFRPTNSTHHGPEGVIFVCYTPMSNV